jgi:hypothetical protein
MTDEALHQAIHAAYRMLGQQEPGCPLYVDLREHFRALLAAQKARATMMREAAETHEAGAGPVAYSMGGGFAIDPGALLQINRIPTNRVGRSEG